MSGSIGTDELQSLHDLVSELYDPVTTSYIQRTAVPVQFQAFIRNRGTLANQADELSQADLQRLLNALNANAVAFQTASAALNRTLNQLNDLATLLANLEAVVAVAGQIAKVVVV